MHYTAGFGTGTALVELRMDDGKAVIRIDRTTDTDDLAWEETDEMPALELANALEELVKFIRMHAPAANQPS